MTILDTEGTLNVEALREVAHREMEIAQLMGPSDDLEEDWLHYLSQLVSLTDAWLDRARGVKHSCHVEVYDV